MMRRPTARSVLGHLVLLALLAGGAPAWGDEVGPPYQRLIETVARRNGIDAKLFAALVEVESARDAGAVSSAGATGLAQLMPQTARRFGVTDPANPEDNLGGAARYLKWLIERYGGNLEHALAAYNAGEGAVDRFAGVPPYPETKAFVERVMRRAGLLPDGASGRAKRDTPRPARLIQREDGSFVITNQ